MSAIRSFNIAHLHLDAFEFASQIQNSAFFVWKHGLDNNDSPSGQLIG